MNRLQFYDRKLYADNVVDDDDDFEFAKVRRGRRRDRRLYDDDKDSDYDDDGGGDFELNSASSRKYYRGSTSKESSVMDTADLLEESGYLDDYDYDDDEDDDESYDMLSDTIIPSPLMDSIDPDGAAERFPELVSDWRFWLDIFLLWFVLDFLSFVGPRHSMKEFMYMMQQAAVTPPPT